MLDFPERSYLILDKSKSTENEMFNHNYIKLEEKSLIIVIGNLLPYKLFRGKEKSFLFIGDFYDPINPKRTNDEVIIELYKNRESFDEIIENTYSIFGKWIIFEIEIDSIRCMGDPHNTKNIKYHTHYLAISDTASIVDKVVNDTNSTELIEEKGHKNFLLNEYRRTNWWCGDSTLYINILALLPNHVLEIKVSNTNLIGINTVRMLYTNKNKHSDDESYLEHCYLRTKVLLEGFFESLSNRKKYGLTVTGGKDSRILFSASNTITKNQAQYFIAKYSNMADDEQDLILSSKLCGSLNVKLNVFEKGIDEDLYKAIKVYFPEISIEYTKYYHAKDLERSNTVVYGVIPEVISGYYYNRLFRISARGLAELAGHSTSLYAISKYKEWLDKIEEKELPKGYTILDLFYWEHRSGRWATQSVNVCDLFQDSIWGFNCREFYDIWMKAPLNIRQWPERKNLNEIIEMFGIEYSRIPYEKPISTFGILRGIVEKNKVLLLLSRQVYYKIKYVKEKLYSINSQ